MPLSDSQSQPPAPHLDREFEAFSGSRLVLLRPGIGKCPWKSTKDHEERGSRQNSRMTP